MQTADAISYNDSEDEETGGTITITMRYADGKLFVENEYTMDTPFITEYWENQPDGQYELFITQGGIRNREIPRNEKNRLISFISEYYYEIQNFDGLIWLFR